MSLSSLQTKFSELIMNNKVFLWLAIATGLLLLLPLFGMQLSSGVKWDETDFIVMGALIFGFGSLFILVARKMRNHLLLLAAIFALLFMFVWAELAVGVFTNLGS